jgi:hypothetical protein
VLTIGFRNGNLNASPPVAGQITVTVDRTQRISSPGALKSYSSSRLYTRTQILMSQPFVPQCRELQLRAIRRCLDSYLMTQLPCQYSNTAKQNCMKSKSAADVNCVIRFFRQHRHRMQLNDKPNEPSPSDKLTVAHLVQFPRLLWSNNVNTALATAVSDPDESSPHTTFLRSILTLSFQTSRYSEWSSNTGSERLERRS